MDETYDTYVDDECFDIHDYDDDDADDDGDDYDDDDDDDDNDDDDDDEDISKEDEDGALDGLIGNLSESEVFWSSVDEDKDGDDELYSLDGNFSDNFCGSWSGFIAWLY